MTVSIEELKKRLNITPRRQAKIDARVKQLIEEEMTLKQLRKAQHLTQEQIASVLGVEQDSVSKLERRADMLLSTMSSYVEAMGGTLHLVAEFPNLGPVAVRLGDLLEGEKKRKRKRAKQELPQPTTGK